jgi:hypothetical protein
MLEKLEDTPIATHLIASGDKDQLKRTPKLMIALCRTPNIVHSDWLTKSAAEGKVLDTKEFLLLNQKKAEKRYDFNMSQSLERAKELRDKGGLLLSGYDAYICVGVAGSTRKGNLTPSNEDFRMILKGAGVATVLTSLPSELKNPTIVITSKLDAEATKQLAVKKVVAAMNGQRTVVKTTEELFHSIMTQEFKA